MKLSISYAVSLVVIFSSVFVLVSAIEENQSPVHVRERFRRSLASSDHSVRKRREIEIPKGTTWEVLKI